MAEEQKKQIFRQKSLERISSPEQLTDYLRVTNPGIWVLFAIIALLLAGFFAWASIGQLETTKTSKAIVEDGTAFISVPDNVEVTAGMPVRLGNEEFTISYVDEDDLERKVAFAPASIANGTYDAEIVVERMTPITFLMTAR